MMSFTFDFLPRPEIFCFFVWPVCADLVVALGRNIIWRMPKCTSVPVVAEAHSTKVTTTTRLAISIAQPTGSTHPGLFFLQCVRSCVCDETIEKLKAKIGSVVGFFLYFAPDYAAIAFCFHISDHTIFSFAFKNIDLIALELVSLLHAQLVCVCVRVVPPPLPLHPKLSFPKRAILS